jgi:hypothetical protein
VIDCCLTLGSIKEKGQTLVVSVSKHYNNPAQRLGLEQSGPHHHFFENLAVK